MQVLERNRKEIEERARTMSDFLKMEYLELCIRKINDADALRYCFSELSKIYESKSMYPEAIKYIIKFQETCSTQSEKNKAMQKEIELLIKAGFYERADLALKELIKHVSEGEKLGIKRTVIELYAQLMKKYEISGRNSELIKIYSRLVNYLSDRDRDEIKKKMVISLKKVGKIRESIELEKELQRQGIVQEKDRQFRF